MSDALSYIGKILASNVAPQIGPGLKPHLRNWFYGGMVRKRPPQIWWFVTNSGSATLHVDQNGDAVVYDGQTGQPDGKITWTDHAFYAAIVQRDRAKVPPEDGQPGVEIYTAKGREAFGQFRARFGV